MLTRASDSVRRIGKSSLVLPGLATVLTAALVIASFVSMIALRSGTAEAEDVSGEWEVGLVIHDGPAQESIGQSRACGASLVHVGTVLEGDLECRDLGRSTELTGFVSRERDTIRLSARFAESWIEVLAELVSATQLVGSWEDSQGFSGRFVAIRESVPGQ